MRRPTPEIEVVRRALDAKDGRIRHRCRTRRHRWQVWLLARRRRSWLANHLHRAQVRHDPPAWARTCTCEDPR